MDLLCVTLVFRPVVVTLVLVLLLVVLVVLLASNFVEMLVFFGGRGK